jgi:hypothetical protein
MPVKQQQTADPVTDEQQQQQTTGTATAPMTGNKQHTLAIGRIVHFVVPNGSERPAIVTRVYADSESRTDQAVAGLCDLVVFTNAEEHGVFGAAYGQGKVSYDGSNEPKGNTWHWHTDQHGEISPSVSSTTAPEPQTSAGSSVASESASGSAS